MDHVVYVDAQANEMEKLLSGEKTIIIRGATGRKLPYGRISVNDELYLIRNNGEEKIIAKCFVNEVVNSDMLTPEESISLVKKNLKELNLSEGQYSKWAGKRYLVLIHIDSVEEIKSFKIDKSNFGNIDDWLPVEDIESVKK